MKNIFTCILAVVTFAVAQLPATAQKKQIAYFIETLDAGKFIPSDTGTYEYDAHGRMQTERYNYYDNTTKKWVTYARFDYVYNGVGQVDYYQFNTFGNGVWLPSFKYSYTYVGGKKTIELEQNWKNNTWENTQRKVYSYGANGKEDSITTYVIKTNGIEEPLYLTLYSYTAANEIDTELTQWWHVAQSKWEMSGRRKYTYNTANKPIKAEYERLTTTWERVFFTTYSYDAENLQRRWELTEYATNTVTQRGYYFYEFDGPLSTASPATPITMYAFPNPAKEYTTLQWEGNNTYLLQVTDICGREVYGAVVSGQNATINTTGFINGTYFYSLQNQQGQTYRGKFIVAD